MIRKKKCKIVSVGKRRDGGTRFWCTEHKADATAKYGVQASKCRYADLPEPNTDEILKLDISQYPGGIALWGAVPPIYDTTSDPIEYGIHVHARLSANDHKEIDKTFKRVEVVKPQDGSGVIVSELDAIYYMVSSVFGHAMKYVECSYCKYPHLDKDWFSLHSHQRHLCAGCGKNFRDMEKGIGNPIVGIQESLGFISKSPKKINKRREISQENFPGGIQIWGSNQSILWTGDREEEEGIHLHAFMEDGFRRHDDTYSEVIIDGIALDPLMIRTFMAQKAIPHIQGRITTLKCPKCHQMHFSGGVSAFTPQKTHKCSSCAKEFDTVGRLRNVISNPLVDVFSQLEKTAPRISQQHKVHFLPETL